MPDLVQTLFLPFADQDHPPLNLKAICVEIERQLDPLSPDVERAEHANRLGIRVSSARIGSQTEPWQVLEPALPRGVFADPRS